MRVPSCVLNQISKGTSTTTTTIYIYTRPPELDVDDSGMPELVVAFFLGHGAERRAAEVEVVGGHRVVVHVGDDHRLRDAGALRVGDATNL
jgi:hypothetical protein